MKIRKDRKNPFNFISHEFIHLISDINWIVMEGPAMHKLKLKQAKCFFLTKI